MPPTQPDLLGAPSCSVRSAEPPVSYWHFCEANGAHFTDGAWRLASGRLECTCQLFGEWLDVRRIMGKPFTAEEVDGVRETTAYQCQALAEWIGVSIR